MCGYVTKTEEAKAIRVNLITGNTKKGSDETMHKIGCALVMLMECMTKATATAVDGECDSSLATDEPGFEFVTWSILLIIGMAIFAAGYWLGRQCMPAATVKSIGTQAEETYPGPERYRASRVCPEHEAEQTKNFEKLIAKAMATKDKQTQSQVTYTRWTTTPRFKPLAQESHGGWG